MTFWDHLEELRLVLLRCLIAAALFAALAFTFKDEVFAVVLAPKSPSFLGGIYGDTAEVQLISTELTRQFVLHITVSFYVGIIIASPYIIYELYRFILPALYQDERHYSTPLIITSYMMFICGVVFCYTVVFPITFRFLGNYQVESNVSNLISIESYIDTLVCLSLAMGTVFEMPIVAWLFGRLGLIGRQQMRRYRRHALVVILIVAAIITPTSDAFTLAIVSLPMYMLYELSILLTPCRATPLRGREENR